MVIDDFYLSLQYYLLNFNSPIYTDYEFIAKQPFSRRQSYFNTHVYGLQDQFAYPTILSDPYFNSPMYTDCKGIDIANPR